MWRSSVKRTDSKNIVSFQTRIISFSCYYQHYNIKTKLEKAHSTSSYTEHARICITSGTQSSYFFSFPLSLVFPALLNVELSLREVGFSSRSEQNPDGCSNDSPRHPLKEERTRNEAEERPLSWAGLCSQRVWASPLDVRGVLLAVMLERAFRRPFSLSYRCYIFHFSLLSKRKKAGSRKSWNAAACFTCWQSRSSASRLQPPAPLRKHAPA